MDSSIAIHNEPVAPTYIYDAGATPMMRYAAWCFQRSVPICHKFTGKERDSESGLDEFGARYYGSSLGRFMTPDWAAKPTDVPYANFGNPQSLNLYSYVQNNPTTVGDPDGHDCCDDFLNFLGGVANTYGSDNLLGAGRVEQTTTAGRIGAAVGDFGATVTGGLETLGGGSEALVTAPAGATGVGIVVPAVGVAVAPTVCQQRVRVSLICLRVQVKAEQSTRVLPKTKSE
jgi:RHS repeat-associated protein